MELEHIVSGLSYLGIFIMMLSNGIFSFPSSQVLYVVVGYFVSTGFLSFPLALLAGTVGNTIGNIALYEFAREHGEKAALKFLPNADTHIKTAEHYFKKRGLFFLFISKLLPALKVFTPIFGGIAKAPRIPYAALMFIGSGLWAAAFVYLGMLFGKNTDVFKTYSGPLLLIAILVLLFFIVNYKRTHEERTKTHHSA